MHVYRVVPSVDRKKVSSLLILCTFVLIILFIYSFLFLDETQFFLIFFFSKRKKERSVVEFEHQNRLVVA